MGYVYRSSVTGRFIRKVWALLFPWLSVRERR
jgi:hypothetical protein